MINLFFLLKELLQNYVLMLAFLPILLLSNPYLEYPMLSFHYFARSFILFVNGLGVFILALWESIIYALFRGLHNEILLLRNFVASIQYFYQ